MKSTYEASDIIGVSYQTILNWIRKGYFTGIEYRGGFAGRDMMYIPDGQVYAMKAQRDAGKKRFYSYPVPEEEAPDDRDLLMNQLLKMEEEVLKAEMQIGRIHVMIDRMKDLLQ